ncbi:MAG: NAD(P)-dependent oxidoreductase [Thermodesulfobacteriaceae bacterium]|nr:NAD(P)-dependent oxidoreductase [Thermodesulfobacteriaceae bacterium]
MKIGFIGLGTLGKEIVKKLLEGGVEVIVWNRTSQKAQEMGLPMVNSPQELIEKVDRVFVILFDSLASKEVILGEKGLIKGSLKNKTVIDMTTNHPNYVVEVAKILENKGAYYLDAPVLGSVIPARKGELTILVGGNREKFEENRFLFEKYGKNIFYVGEVGKATKLKLINNIVLAGFMEILAEALAIGELAGLEKSQIIEILSAGAGRSAILEVKKPKLLEEDFSVHFSVDLMYKDLHYVQDLIKELKGCSLVTSVIKEVYGLARKKGLGEKDFSIVYKVLKDF